MFGEWRTLPVNVFVEQQLQATLDAQGTGEVQFYWESLDDERLTDQQQYESLAASLGHKYAGKKFDLIFATMPASVRFLDRYGSRLFGHTPVVFCIVNRGALRPALPENMTGAVTDFHAGPTLKMMLDVHPRVKRIVLLVGTSSLGQEWLEEAQHEFDAVSGRARIDVVRVTRIDEALRYVAGLPADTLVYYLIVIRTGDGRYVAPRTVLASVSAASAVAVYVSDDRFVGTGGIGGYVIDNNAAVLTAVRMASRILSGATISAVPLQTIPTRLKFDAHQLKRWNIAEARLPSTAEIINLSPSVWQTYRVQILVTAAIIALESAVIVMLVLERKRRAALQLQVSAQLREMHSLSARLLTAQEGERRRLARELHDDVKQRVALIGLGLSNLKRAAATHDIKKRLVDLSASANDLAATLSRLSRGLHPSRLEHATLESALRSLCRECKELTGIPVDLQVTSEMNTQPPFDTKVCVYRIAQEALQNIAKHSHATAATVSLTEGRARLELSVEDNGSGFNGTMPKPASAGLGLLSMRERLGIVGGTLNIESSLGRGTRLVAVVPVQPPAMSPNVNGAALQDTSGEVTGPSLASQS